MKQHKPDGAKQTSKTRQSSRMVPWNSASLGSLMEPFPVPFHAGCPLSGQQLVLKQWQKG